MKKTLLSALAICMIFLASCNKDNNSGNGGTPGGSQTVGARLSAVWEEKITYREETTDGGVTWHVTETTYGEKYKKESFTWDGNKITNIRDYYDGPNYSPTYYDFMYDGEKISDVLVGGTHIHVHYSGNKVSSFDLSNGGETVVGTISYSNNKVSKIEEEFEDEYGTDYQTIVFHWDGDNVSSINMTGWGSSRFNSYDDGNNPYLGSDAMMFFVFSSIEEFACAMSKNNCTDIDFDEGPITIEYSYNSKNYPTKAVKNWTHPSWGSNYRTRTVTTYTYEYVD